VAPLGRLVQRRTRAGALTPRTLAESMRRLIGIDPGLAGGLGVLDLSDTGHVAAVALVRTPVVTVRRGGRVRREYDVAALLALVGRLCAADDLPGHPVADASLDGRVAGVEVAIETQHAMPRSLHGRVQGGAFTFRLGYGFCLWVGIVAALRCPYRTVTAA
jgi:hypothetical protein